MPDDFFHKHQVPEMGMAAWHKPGQKIKRCLVADGPGYREIVALADNDAPTHEIRDFGEFGKHWGDWIYTKFGKRLLNIQRRSA